MTATVYLLENPGSLSFIDPETCDLVVAFNGLVWNRLESSRISCRSVLLDNWIDNNAIQTFLDEYDEFALSWFFCPETEVDTSKYMGFSLGEIVACELSRCFRIPQLGKYRLALYQAAGETKAEKIVTDLANGSGEDSIWARSKLGDSLFENFDKERLIREFAKELKLDFQVIPVDRVLAPTGNTTIDGYLGIGLRGKRPKSLRNLIQSFQNFLGEQYKFFRAMGLCVVFVDKSIYRGLARSLGGFLSAKLGIIVRGKHIIFEYDFAAWRGYKSNDCLPQRDECRASYASVPGQWGALTEYVYEAIRFLEGKVFPEVRHLIDQGNSKISKETKIVLGDLSCIEKRVVAHICEYRSQKSWFLEHGMACHRQRVKSTKFAPVGVALGWKKESDINYQSSKFFRSYVVTGNPIIDKYSGKRSSRNQNRILLSYYGNASYTDPFSSNSMGTYYTNLFSALRMVRNERLKFVFRVRGGLPECVLQALEEVGLDENRIEWEPLSVSFFDSISNSGLFVSHVTTGFYEGLACGTPVVLFRPEGNLEGLVGDVASGPVRVISAYRELAELIEEGPDRWDWEALDPSVSANIHGPVSNVGFSIMESLRNSEN